MDNLYIYVTPDSGKIGDLVSVTNSLSSFAEPYTNNVVTFAGLNNSIIAKIFEGDADELKVAVPADAITGYVAVESYVSATALVDPAQFEVVYENIDFEQAEPNYEKATISGNIKSVGTPDTSTPLYNSDLSYSNFTETVDENSLLQNVYSLILTQKGERMFSELGTTIDQLLFSTYSDDAGFRQSLMTEVINVVNTYEPRVTVVEEESLVITSGERVELILALLMPSGNIEELGITLKSVNNVDF